MQALFATLLFAAAALPALAHATTTFPYPKDGDAVDDPPRKSGKGAISIAMGEPGCLVVHTRAVVAHQARDGHRA
jgi:hypothetical protein